jgi:cytochrome b6-f complex iron-sulfur subunit
MVDKSKMTVADILAAARKADSQGAAPAGKAKPAAEAPAAPAADEKVAEKAASEQPPVSSTPAPAKKIPASGGGRPSVADMMAMARGAKQDGSAAPAAKESSAAPPAAKPAAAVKAAPKKEPAAAKADPLDTQSILAAARKGTKPGPMTKAEAAAKPAPVAPDAKKAKAKEAIVVPPMPVKPAYAKPTADRAKDELAERRAFLFGMSALAVGFTAMTGTFVLWTLGSVRFMFPNILREPPSRFKVGFPDQFAPGQVQEKFKAQFGVWIVNTEFQGEQQIVALKSVCTHLGCTPNWLEAEQKFKCPCHGSGFYKDGINFEGPAPRPLERYAISLANDGQVEVDKSRTFHEEMGQWADPACFIPA